MEHYMELMSKLMCWRWISLKKWDSCHTGGCSPKMHFVYGLPRWGGQLRISSNSRCLNGTYSLRRLGVMSSVTSSNSCSRPFLISPLLKISFLRIKITGLYFSHSSIKVFNEIHRTFWALRILDKNIFFNSKS